MMKFTRTPHGFKFRLRLEHGSAAAFLFDAIVLTIIAATVYFICAGLASGNDQAAPPPRVLIVWHDPVVPNSRQFFDDLSLQGLAAELHEAGWIVERRDIRNRPLQALALNIQAAPCFVIPGRDGRFWYGYDRDDFREYFGLAPRPDQAATTTGAEPLTPEQLQQFVDDQVAQQRAEFERQLAATTEADQARQLALEQAIAEQRQQLAEIERGNPETEQRIDQLAQILEELAHRDQAAGELQAAPEAPPAAAPGAPPAAAAEGGFLSRAVRVGGYTVTVLQALGVLGATSTGVGCLGIGALALLRRWRRRAPTTGAPSPGRAEKPAVVTVENPPPPQAIVRENTFVPYERDTFAEAFAWAAAEIGRHSPGAVGTLEHMQSLIDQFLSSRGIPKPKRGQS